MAKMMMSDFYCTQCGNKGIPVIRYDNKIREPGHLKKLYCIYCNKENNHVECKEFSKYTHEDFLIEFNNGNFTPEGERRLPWKQFLTKERMKNYA